MQKLSHFVAEFLHKQGISHVFGVTGGAVAHLFDSISRQKGMQAIFHHHEQAAAFAAQAYARIHRTLGCALVTTGPGGTNALTGVCAAWLDSVPCLFISGQTRLQHTSHGKGLRQFGTQELDITTLAAPITKKTFLVTNPQSILSVLEEAVYWATEGRPGPVWIDIPLDMQWAMIDPSQLPSFSPPPKPAVSLKFGEQIYTMLDQAKRPLILFGHGVRLAKAEELAKQWITATQIPYVATWNASDLFPNDEELYIGRPGLFGQRGANLAVQNCDLLLVLGSHLCTSITGTLFKAFAREAKIIMVNIDEKELSHRTVPVHLPIQANVADVLEQLIEEAPCHATANYAAFTQKCRLFKTWNAIRSDWPYYGCHAEEPRVNPYQFLHILSDIMDPNDLIVVDGGGTIVQIAFQTLRTKKRQRLMIDAGLCAMGSGLPQSIGAYFAHQKNVICLCGDGSLQFNVHELQTIAHHQIPIKLFIFNNEGYLSIRHTQKSFLEGHYVGSSAEGGISIPDTLKIAAAYNIDAIRISSSEDAKPERIASFLKAPGPMICEVMVPRELAVAPKQGFRMNKDGTFSPAPLEEMHPPLSPQEVKEVMLVAPWVTQ